MDAKCLRLYINQIHYLIKSFNIEYNLDLIKIYFLIDIFYSTIKKLY